MDLTTPGNSYTLRVLSHPVEVRISASDEQPHTFGYTDRSTLIIRLAGGMSPSMAGHTLLHELVHVGETVSGHRMEEAQVDSIASTFYSFLMDNKDLVRELLDGEV